MHWQKVATLSVAGSALAFSAAPVLAGGGHDPWRLGIWKSSPVPENPNGRFANQDPFALAHGEHIHTDCSIFWIDPDSNELYCFNSGTSKEFFAADPEQYLKAADAVWNNQRQDTGSPERRKK